MWKGSRYLLFGPLFQYSSVQVLTRLKSLSQQIATYRYPQFSWVRKPLSHHIFISVCPFSIARAVYPVGTVGHHEWWISALGSTCIPLRLSICALIWASALTLDIRHGDQVQRPFHIIFLTNESLVCFLWYFNWNSCIIWHVNIVNKYSSQTKCRRTCTFVINIYQWFLSEIITMTINSA